MAKRKQQLKSISQISEDISAQLNARQQFYLAASKVVALYSFRKYYQLKLNSSIDTDNAEEVKKASEKGVNCIRCGSVTNIRLKSRRKLNKSSERKHCRYLKQLVRLECGTCFSHSLHKLIKSTLPKKKVTRPIEKHNQVAKPNPSIKRTLTTKGNSISTKKVKVETSLTRALANDKSTDGSKPSLKSLLWNI